MDRGPGGFGPQRKAEGESWPKLRERRVVGHGSHQLLSDDERRGKLERIEEAYQRIVGTRSLEKLIERIGRG